MGHERFEIARDDRPPSLIQAALVLDLKRMYQRQGKVVERSALLHDVWGYEYAGGSNVIEAIVRSVRRKLGRRAATIETVRGMGYRFVAG